MSNSPIVLEEVGIRIRFAEWRLDDLKKHLDSGLSGVRIGQRLQLLQEFLFHLVGTREVLALFINEKRRLALDPEEVSIGKVLKLLPEYDPIRSMVRELAVDPRKEPFPSDPYTEAAYVYRAILYRNQVAHRHRQPFHIEMHFPTSRMFLYLDPRNPEAGHSKIESIPELKIMFNHLSSRYNKIIAVLRNS